MRIDRRTPHACPARPVHSAGGREEPYAVVAGADAGTLPTERPLVARGRPWCEPGREAPVGSLTYVVAPRSVVVLLER